MADPITVAALAHIGITGFNKAIQSLGAMAAKNAATNIGGLASKSLVEFTRTLRVEPICMIEQGLAHHEVMMDVQQTLLSIFSGYYLQAVARDTTVGNVTVTRVLDKLNPSRNALDTVSNMGLIVAGLEGLDEGAKLPTVGQNFDRVHALEALKESVQVSNEAMVPSKVNINIKETINHDDGEKTVKATPASHVDAIKEVRDLANLAVGKLLNVEITDGTSKVTVPVAVRLQTASLPKRHLVDLLAYGDTDYSAKARYHGWRSGRLQFWRDIVFCRDIIKERRSNLMKDKTGIYKEMLSRKRSNQMSAAISGIPSVATMSNIVVISQEALNELEVKINGRMDNFRVRERIFDATALMLFAVVDSERNQVTIYHQSIPQPTTLAFAALKNAAKKDNNIADILAAFQMGSAPRF